MSGLSNFDDINWVVKNKLESMEKKPRLVFQGGVAPKLDAGVEAGLVSMNLSEEEI